MKLLPILAIILPAALGSPAKRAASPTVTIAAPEATIVGALNSTIETFVGIPFAQPPTGSLRLRPPQALNTSLGIVNASTGSTPGCPQFIFSVDTSDFPTDILGLLVDLPFFQEELDVGEDCLTLNVIRPTGTTSSSALPVLFWIFGGAFELGTSLTWSGEQLVADSITLGKPIVFVGVNYRIGGFGFLGGSEILADGSSNLGLLDQRLGLEWVSDNIEAFGGDPTKVTIFGESAGSISVLDQLALYDGDFTYNDRPLFRAAIMDSGTIVAADPVDCPKAQKVYDTVVENGGCASASDTLECLRSLDYTTFLNAANSVPGTLGYECPALSYLPRPDGVVLTASPDVLIQEGKYAKVPFIVGDQEDEGTFFSLFEYNISTTAEMVDYLSTFLFQDATVELIEDFVATYPDDAIDGSPFGTLIFNEWYPQYKRMAALLGDILFTLTRRGFLNTTSSIAPDVPSWSYLATYDFGTPILGTYHGSDLLQIFYGIEDNFPSPAIHEYYLSFIYTMDPNNGTPTQYIEWPQWSANNELLDIGPYSSSLLADNFREENYQFIIANVDSLHQ